MTRNANRPGQFAGREPLAKRRAQPITGIRQDAAKADAGRDDTIQLRQSQSRRPPHPVFGWNARSLQPRPVARPTLGKEQPQCQHDRHFAARQAPIPGSGRWRPYPKLKRIAPLRQPVRALLRFGIVNRHHGTTTPDELIRLDKQFRFHRRHIPDPGRNEVMQLIVFAKRKPLCHRLNALAIARANQSRHVQRTHPLPSFVPQQQEKA